MGQPSRMGFWVFACRHRPCRGGEAVSDRELLELAAKMAGIEVTAIVADGIPHRFGGGYWNPLTDDGDALRLAVKLLFEFDMGRGCIVIRHSVGIKILEAFNHDPYAATRRAIVRAAAEIGRNMK
jgi:hypothetical protein